MCRTPERVVQATDLSANSGFQVFLLLLTPIKSGCVQLSHYAYFMSQDCLAGSLLRGGINFRKVYPQLPPFPQLPATVDLFSISVDLPLLDISLEWALYYMALCDGCFHLAECFQRSPRL